MSNLLFICSKNQWRSPAAEVLFKGHRNHSARSAGTSDKARIKLTQKIIDWADVLFFMERRHLEIARQRFRLDEKTINVLDIEDNFPFNDPELIGILKVALAEYFNL